MAKNMLAYTLNTLLSSSKKQYKVCGRYNLAYTPGLLNEEAEGVHRLCLSLVSGQAPGDYDDHQVYEELVAYLYTIGEHYDVVCLSPNWIINGVSCTLFTWRVYLQERLL